MREGAPEPWPCLSSAAVLSGIKEKSASGVNILDPDGPLALDTVMAVPPVKVVWSYASAWTGQRKKTNFLQIDNVLLSLFSPFSGQKIRY